MKSDLKDRAVSHVHAFGLFRGPWLFAISSLLGRRAAATSQLANGRRILLRPGTTDTQVYMEVFTFGEYDFSYPSHAKVIVDVGANVGITTLWFHQSFPGAHILAIEPDAQNYEMLLRNTGSVSNVTTRRAAIWSTRTNLHLLDQGKGSWGYVTTDSQLSQSPSGSWEGGSPNSSTVVEGYTMEEIIEDEGLDHIDILKVDIEGSEREMFKDPSGWIDRVGSIVIELHEEMAPGVTDLFRDATSCFRTRFRRGNTEMVIR